MSKDVTNQLAAIDAMNLQISSSENPAEMTDDGSSDSSSAADSSTTTAPLPVASVDPNASGADRFRASDDGDASNTTS